jgi:DNA polymerase
MGRPATIADLRGKPIAYGPGRSLLVTVHPSMLLRIPDAEARSKEFKLFVADLERIAAAV